MKKMTKQACFNKVWDWFVMKAKPKSIQGGSCLYRGPTKDYRCAVGILMPDAMYDPRIEGQPASSLYEENGAFRRLFAKDVTPEFLTSLQRAHDDVQAHVFPVGVEAALVAMAPRYDLKIPKKAKKTVAGGR